MVWTNCMYCRTLCSGGQTDQQNEALRRIIILLISSISTNWKILSFSLLKTSYIVLYYDTKYQIAAERSPQHFPVTYSEESFVFARLNGCRRRDRNYILMHSSLHLSCPTTYYSMTTFSENFDAFQTYILLKIYDLIEYIAIINQCHHLHFIIMILFKCNCRRCRTWNCKIWPIFCYSSHYDLF